MVRVEIGKTLTHLREQNSQSETDVIIFDTSQPADSSTGLPPVKAKVKHRRQVQSKDSTAQTSEEQTTANVERQTTDKGKTQATTDSKEKKTEKPAHTIFEEWLCGLLCVVVVVGAVAAVIKYKRKKTK